MEFVLREYQEESIARIYDSFENGIKKILFQLPTGGGKTVILSKICQDLVAWNKDIKILILAHRKELILQAVDKLGKFVNCEIGIIKAGYEENSNAQIQVASVQTLVRRLSVKREFDLIIIDEAHHAVADSYRSIFDRFDNANLLGVTATPIRLNGEGFDDIFEKLICGTNIKELIKLGYLCNYKLYASTTPMSVKGCRKKNGDYSASDLARANNIKVLSGNLVEQYLTYAQGKSCLVFAINVEHSKAICQRYLINGISAYHLDGRTPDEERSEVLRRFVLGEIKILCNCALFDEGLDIPYLEAVQIAKPTGSLSRWLQMVGRVLRPAPDKELAVILDHTDNWKIHKLPDARRIWTLEGVIEEEEVVEEVEELLGQNPGKPQIVELEEEELEEIDLDEEEQWNLFFKDLIYVQQSRGYKKGWIYYRLKEEQPPLEIWLKASEYLGYKEGWAYIRFNECNAESRSA